MDYQVFQRHTKSQGEISVLVHSTESVDSIEARLDNQPWQQIANSIQAPAGGCYRLEVRTRRDGKTTATAGVDHVGVGEVFVVAGQSNSTNYGEELQRTRTRMVATFDGQTWRLADDPQPGVQDDSHMGSFLPPFGDALYEKLRVPIGVASAGAGSTSVRQWLPRGDRFASQPTAPKFVLPASPGEWESDGRLFEGLLARIRQLGSAGSFRALLWHQGESDAHQPAGHEISAAEYRRMMERLIRESRREAGWAFPWLVAQATYHSPVDPGAPEIRDAQASLWSAGLAFPGPDTDTLTGGNRQNGGRGVHMSGKGLEAHGRLWAEKVLEFLARIGAM